MSPTTPTERIAILETLVEAEHFANEKRDRDIADINSKLDELLALRNKGLGAFWLATSLVGVGAISVFYKVLTWLGLLPPGTGHG